MARGRYNNLAVNPYENFQLDVQYFDRKALERQQRHDVARENYSKFAQQAANDDFLDPEARKVYLEQQQSEFDNVLAKNAGNLSAGYQDILGAIEKSKNNPYHNLNKRQIEQSQIRQKLVSQYGDKAIDLSNINQPLYQRDEEGNITWSNPADISANVVEANNYQAIIEKMLADTEAMQFSNQTGLGGGSGNAFYLMSKITKGEVLSPQQLMQIASDPSVQQAFLANASTAGIDNRKVAGSDMTYKEMFTNPQGLAQYIYGNIQDKQRNNEQTQNKFVRNVGLEKAVDLANRKKAIAYEQNMKNMYTKPLEERVDVGETTITGKSINQFKENLNTNKQSLGELRKTQDSNLHDFNQIMGTRDNGILQFSDNNLNFNRDKAKNWLELNEVDPTKIDDILDNAELAYRKNEETRISIDQIEGNIDQQENYLNGIDNKLASEYYNELPKYKKDYLKQQGINNTNDLIEASKSYKEPGIIDRLRAAFRQAFGGKYDPKEDGPVTSAFTRMTGLTTLDHTMLGFEDYKEDKYDKGFKSGIMESGIVSNDPNSLAYQHNEFFKNNADKLGYKRYLSTFKDIGGGNLRVNYVDSEKGSLDDWLEEYGDKIDPKASQFIYDSQNDGKGGYTTHILLKTKPDSDGNTETFDVFNAIPQNSNKVGSEIASRRANQGYTLYATSEDYDDRFIEDVNVDYGSIHYGNEISDKVNVLTQNNTPTGTSFNIPVTLHDGSETSIFMKKLDNGYVGMVGNNPKNKFFMDNPTDEESTKQTRANMKRLFNRDIGQTMLLYGNPQFTKSLNFYGNFKSNKLPSISGNIKK